jgi:hypothetical protein
MAHAHLALGLLLLAASAAAVSAKHPLLSDRLRSAPARASSAQPAYDDKSKRACFAETEVCESPLAFQPLPLLA